MDFLSQKHDVTVYTTNAIELNSFWDPSAKTTGNIQNFHDKNYKVKRYQILQPAAATDNSDPFSILSPGPFCPGMWNDLLNMKDNFDLIIATAFPYDHIIPALIASKKQKIPIIMIPHLHLEFPELYFTGLRIMLLQEADAIVVNTETEKNSLLKYDIVESKISIIPAGIPIHKAEPADFRNNLNISKDSLLVLFAGTKSHAKGTINLIESMKKFWDASIDHKLVLIGPSMNDFNEYLKKQDQKYLKHIHDLGLVSDTEKWNAFASCDIFALPSKSESFGISYLDAWLNKKPVIGCSIDAVQNLIDDNMNGLLVGFGNIGELSNALDKLQDPKLRDKLGKNGFEKLLARYDSQKTCKQFEELCNSFSELRG